MADPPFRHLFGELRRRKVFRVALGYAVIAWLVLQVGDVVVEPLRLPEWTMPLLIVLAALGFPVSVVLAWAFDLTPGGIERTLPLAPGAPPIAALPAASAPPVAGRIAAVTATLMLASAGGAFIMLKPVAPEMMANRVVVQPFENRSGDPALDAVGTMAADWLVRGLQRAASLEVVPLGATLSAGAPEAGSTAARARATGLDFGARIIVSGAYYLERDSLRFLAEVTDAGRRQLLYTSEPVSAPRASPSEGLEQLRQAVSGFLAVWGRHSGMGEEALATAMRPPEYAAYQEFVTGFELFARLEFRASQPYFARAVALDSGFVSALVYRATAHSNIGEWAEAQPYVRRLGAIRGALTPYERQWLHRAG